MTSIDILAGIDFALAAIAIAFLLAWGISRRRARRGETQSRRRVG
ncbi:MAG TPA: hypothetical protein VGM50_20950 [Gemmatimonadaceae bacterium]|jgi:hypothetical protein